MSKNTPQMYARGKYDLKAPWSANQQTIYTCIAIRSFEDIYKQGEDVYEVYYRPFIHEDQDTPTGSFDFSKETLLKPNIITLRSETNEIIYVPDTFILSYPDTTAVIYSHLIAGVDLGVLPDEYSTDLIETALVDLVKTNFGIEATVQIIRAPSSYNPTPEEHEQLVALREGAIAVNPSNELQLEATNAELARLGAYVRQLEDTIRTLQSR